MKTVQDLKSLQAEAILRLNCPGFGGSSLLTCGQARPLTDYKVIIVNPTSIVHVFEEDAAIIRQIDIALAEGLTSCKLADDDVINRISQQIEARSPELFQFLAEGGLLIYYLCRPFVVNTESRAMDNYAWLCGLAPDQSGESTVSEQAVRHMSTMAHGRNIDICTAASESEFEKYLEQVGLEWNTIIRTDFLTSGYSPLAQAGPKKCIAGELIAGDNGGKVIFLPAPYSPDFDRVLVECINIWHTTKLDSAGDFGQNVVGVLNGEHSLSNGEVHESTPVSFNEGLTCQPVLEENEQNNNQSIKNEALGDSGRHLSSSGEDEIRKEESDIGNVFGNESVTRANLKEESSEIEFERAQPTSSAQKNDEEAPNDQEVKALRIKEGFTEEATMSDWCKSYWLPGMDSLFREIQVIRKQITELERKLVTSEDMISSLEGVKATLLSGKPGNLLESCKIVLSELGFTAKAEGNNELILSENDQRPAVARIVLSLGSPERNELARLTGSLINFWDSHGFEPKGILIACTYCDTPITQRKEADFSDIILDFATKRNVCLISTTQLISIYLDMKLGKIETDKVRADILSTAGALKGFSL